MEKSIVSPEYKVFLQELRAMRRELGVSQVELANRLGATQSFVSKCERGERRLDIVEFRAFCRAMGVSLADFIERLEKKLAADG
jgi:transcriptional regulator with XRE-family HTH domain